MEKDLNNSAIQNTSPKNEEDSEKSFVGKFKSIITNTPLSKWFRKLDDSTSKSTIRRRNDDAEDDEIQQMQPPSKRVKFPSTEENNHFNSVTFKKTLDSTNISVNQTSQKHNHFPEPVAGPSGMKTHKLLSNVVTSISTSGVRNKFSSNEMLNGHKDSDSEESTSGYSSVPRIGSKDNVSQSQESSKQTSPLQNINNSRSLFQNQNTSTDRSLFTDRTLSPKMNSSMTTRRPSFNASTFGSPNFIDKTIATEKIINSPFYSGRTIYGGASAYGRKLGRSSRDLRSSLKRPVQIKPVEKNNDTGNLTLGKTARRILETLEQYSSPINDAKKIPVASKRFKSDGLLSGHVGGSPYSFKGGDTPSKKELQVPTVSDLLKIKQKARLQNSTETVRNIAISSKSDLNSEQNLLSQQNPTRENDNKTDKPQQQNKDKPVAEHVESNATSLPTTTLPKFVIYKPPHYVDNMKDMPPKVAPLQATIINTTPKATIETEKNVQKENSDATPFRFSAPLVIAENMKSIIAINNFKFSEPIDNLKKAGSSNDRVIGMDKNEKSFEMASKTKSSPASEHESTSLVKSAGVGVKSANQWECTICMVRNNESDSKCVCCTASKPSGPKTDVPTNHIPSSFGDKFKIPTSMWECSVCMVRNDNSKTKCSACETPNHKAISNETSSNSISLMKKFQPPASTWECPSCLIRNKSEVVKCAACESPRTGSPMVFNSFNATFKKKDDEWECQICMVRNKTTNVKCQCCESLKPGSNLNNSTVAESTKQPLPKFNFGIDKAAAASFSFGIPPSTSSTLPKPAVEPAIVFGEDAKKATPAATFSFGVKPEVQNTKTSLLAPPKKAETNDEVKKTTDKTDAPVPVVSFQFGSATATTTQSSSVINKKVESISKPVAITTTTTTPTTNSSVPEVLKPTFSFSVAPSSSDKVGNKTDTSAKDNVMSPPAKLFSFGSKPSVTTSALTPTPAAGISVNQNTLVSQAPAAVTSQNTMPKPSFSFGASKTTADSSSGSIFGAKTTAANTSFAASFGSSKTSATPALGTISGGNASTSVPSFGSSTNAFGGASKPPTEAAPFSFAAPPSVEPAPKAATFSFGQATAARDSRPAAPSAGFDVNFGAAHPSPAPFGFAAPKAAEAPPSRVFNFGAGAQTNNAQRAGFSFGGAFDTKPAPAQSGFNFGAAASTPKPAAGGFNFSAVPNFDANVKPLFNFSEAPVTAFTAQPVAESGVPPQRKIRRAVRRTQR